MMDSNYRVVGIFETGLAYEEVAVVVSLRDAQVLTGRPRQVMMYALKLANSGEAERVRDDLREGFPGVDFSLTAEFSESLNDFETLSSMVQQISSLAVFIGGLGMLNTMLMSVLERTREIGVFRALGWRRRQVLVMVLGEALVLGVVGGVVGVGVGLGLTRLVTLIPGLFGSIDPVYPPELFFQALAVAGAAGLVGGLYPAWRAAKMHPAGALRYE
jgi:putative ABC transport system permease protein